MILDLRTTDDPRDMVHRAVQSLVEGEVLGVPTETVYSLAANALCESAVRRLCDLVGGVPPWSLAITARSRDAASDFIDSQTPLVRRLTRRCWPGPLTLLAACPDKRSAVNRLPEGVRRRITDPDGGVAFRVADHRILSHLHRYLSAPLVLAAASPAGSPPPTTAGGVTAEISQHLALLLDDGPTRYGGVSTVVRVAGNHWSVLREGVIERAAMNQFVKPVIALVCTGNTCRSPMAETLLREQLRKRFGREDLVRVVSAGIAAGEGCGASPHAIEVMGRRGLDLTGHSSRPLDESIVNVADLILTMTRGHREAILAAWPDLHKRVFTVRRDEADISDPVGMPIEAYYACADQIEAELAKWVETLDDDFFPQSTSDPE